VRVDGEDLRTARNQAVRPAVGQGFENRAPQDVRMIPVAGVKRPGFASTTPPRS
jgi:hypothetical protein